MSQAIKKNRDLILLICFAAAVFAGPIIMKPFGAGYPDLLQKFAIFGIFALGFNILFGLTGYLSFGHAAFLGVGSYTAVWTFKLLSMNPLPAIILATLVGGDLFSGYRVRFPASIRDLFFHSDSGLCSNELQSGLFRVDPHHQR